MGDAEKYLMSIIIPSYNSDISNLNKCIESIQHSTLKPVEIILVDDCSTKEYISGLSFNGTIVRLEKNSGPAVARNEGAKRASSDILCFIDSDVSIRANTLEQIFSRIQDNEITAVQTIYSAETPVKNIISRYQNLYSYYNFSIINQRYLATLASFCVAVKKEAFFEAGGFDEDIKAPSIEDDHLGISLYNKGYNILLAKDIQVDHMADIDLKKLIKRMFLIGFVKITNMAKKPSTRPINISRRHQPLSLFISVLLSPFIVLSLITSLIFPGALIFALILCLFFLVINRNFFIYIKKQTSIYFTIASIFLFFVVNISAFSGSLAGGTRYVIKQGF